MIELSENIRNYILQHFNEEYLRKYQEYFDSEYEPYIRISPNISVEKLIESLKVYGIQVEPLPNLNLIYKVVQGKNLIGKTLEFILGQYYIQSLSSMIPALVLNPQPNEKVLDLCAAPGSKTTQLCELMNNGGTLIANEISLERMKSLVFNIDKMNAVNVGILKGKGELLSKNYDSFFDKILVDAPCSALGIVQKKGEVSNWWDVQKAEALSDQQLRLLIAAIKMAKAGAKIVYSTCTLSFEENELVLDKILKKYPVKLLDFELPVKSIHASTSFNGIQLDENIIKAKRILPWDNNSEGFFVALLEKTEDLENKNYSKRISKTIELVMYSNSKIKKHLDEMADYFGIEIQALKQYKYLMRSKDIYFVDINWESDNIEDFVRIGSKLGSIEKRGYIQLHTLAAQYFGSIINKNKIEFTTINDLDIYLKGGTIKRDFGSPGQKIIVFNGNVIGMAVASKDGLKSQFPRSLRTQEILLPK